jgi:hypothetical protein
VSDLDIHRLRIIANEPYSASVELDGKPLVCTKVEFTAEAGKPYCLVRVELPAYVEFEGLGETSFVRPVLVRPAEKDSQPDEGRASTA